MKETLQQFVETVAGPANLRVETDFGDGYVRLKTSEAERRQAVQDIRSTEDIVLEMLRNSRDAHASHIYVALSREGSKRTVTVIDDGCGIPASMHELIFEPRVTSKLDTSHIDAWGIHGRGMALFSVSANAEQANVMASEPDKGCAIYVQTNLKSLGEKADQSSFPTFILAEDGKVNVRGPKNILRTTCEFAIECRSQCAVYLGSPAEIVSTLYAYGSSTLSVIDRLFTREDESLPIVKRLACSADPADLAENAALLGLYISERTARRVMDGEIPVLEAMLDQIIIKAPENSKTRTKSSRKRGDARSLKLHPDDVAALSKAVRNAFEDIAESYYLEPDVTPAIRVRKDAITISVPIVKQP